MKSRFDLPDKSRALTICGDSFLSLVTLILVPAVMYKPASTIQLSPNEIPTPAFAPIRQFSPIDIFVSLPPDRVPMVLAPPPKSELLPITTPAETLPSIIALPNVPALKLINPSCITVVPALKYAPSLTLLASAILTFFGTT